MLVRQHPLAARAFPQLERQARAARAGLWVALGTAAEPVPPWEWRKAKRG